MDAVRTVLTIGHSNHPFERFIEMLSRHAVTVVADVRSAPYSRIHPAYNREALEQALEQRGIEYVFLGRELGARSEDRSCYKDGRVQYRKLTRTALFRIGLQRVITGSDTHHLAVMCAEGEPLACHRTVLVGRELEAVGVSVGHIHPDGHLESHGDAMERLLTRFGLNDPDLFRTRQDLIETALALQEERIAYVDPADARGKSAPR